MNKQKGFTLVEGLLIVLILSVVGFASYYVWSQNKDNEPEQTETTQQEEQPENQNNEQSDDASEEVGTVPDEWVEYTNNEFGFSFAYPSEWGDITTTEYEGAEGVVTSLVFEKSPRRDIPKIAVNEPAYMNHGDPRASADNASFERINPSTYKVVKTKPTTDALLNPSNTLELVEFGDVLFYRETRESFDSEYVSANAIFNIEDDIYTGVSFFIIDEFESADILKKIVKTISLN